MKVLRIAHGIEQQSLADATGLSVSLIEKIEAGIRKPTPRAAIRLENFFSRRLFSTPEEYRRRDPVRPAKSKRNVGIHFPAGSQIDLVDNPRAAEQLAFESNGCAVADGSVVTFHAPVTVRISSPRQNKS